MTELLDRWHLLTNIVFDLQRCQFVSFFHVRLVHVFVIDADNVVDLNRRFVLDS